MSSPSVVDRVVGLAARPFVREGQVVAVAALPAGLRRIDLRFGAGIGWQAGQKLQLRVRGADFRTYTPFGWHDDLVSVLALVGSHGPGAEWVARAAVGTTVQAFGPRKAMDLRSLDAAPLLVGDETSVALSAAWRDGGGPAPTAQLYEATDVEGVRELARRMELGPVTMVARTEDDGHHAHLASRVVDLVRAHPEAPLVLTGKTTSIAAVRAALKAADLRPTTRVKAHWDPKRKGLD